MGEMNKTEAQRLLADYVKTGSDLSFRKLVDAHVNLVYATARRLAMGDAALAEDVTQQVFVDLARKAGRLPKDVLLGGWLHRHAWCVAANSIRRERRLKLRESHAATLHPTPDSPENGFDQWGPLLDDAINQLGPGDRSLILLRYFDQMDFRAVGESVGISEDAARMRVTRALEKLHFILKRQGVALSATAVAAMLAGEAVRAAPAGLVSAVCAAARTATVAGFGVSMTTLPQFLIMTKLKLGLIGALTASAAGVLLVGQWQTRERLREEIDSLHQRASLLAADNETLSNRLASVDQGKSLQDADRLELMKLRSESGRLRRQNQEYERLLAKNREAQPSPASVPPAFANMIPRESWVFAGYQTPANALQSMMWAMKSGDLNAFLASLTPEARSAVAKRFEGMSETDVSAALQNEVSGLPSLQLDRIKNVSDSEATFVLYSQETNNGVQKTRDEAVISFKNINGEWKSTEGL